jgi:DhnA family fructose-bisphosphate aldolase class Ia
LGLIAAYGKQYPSIPYIVKLNGRTNLFTDKDKLISQAWHKVEDAVNFKKSSQLKIVGVGYTVYLGGEYESKMLKEAAKIISHAHNNGLLAVIWMYPRNKAIKDDTNSHLLAGAAGVAAALGADFVKIKYPQYPKSKKFDPLSLKEAILAAGRTKVIFAGGTKKGAKEFLEQTAWQIDGLGTGGLAVGRNIHQREEKEAIRFLSALGEIVHKKAKAKEAYLIYQGKFKPAKKKSSLLFGLF